MTNSLKTRLSGISRELALFIFASFAVGMASSLIDSTFNNFLNDSFSLSGFQRSFLEFPREIPGFIVVFASALLWFLGSRKMGALALLLGSLGVFLLGFSTQSFTVMVMFLFILSMGQHLFIPVSTTIGMELARDGKTGHRLGQLNAIRNMAAIVGSAVVFIGFRYFGLTYQINFSIAALLYAVGMVMLTLMQPSKVEKINTKDFLKLRKEYTLYYVLSVLFGSRKQIFFTFGPWVIVTIYGKPTQTIATLILIGGVIGILFQPLLGKGIDKLGEKVVLASEAVLLTLVCLGYALSKSIFSRETLRLSSPACATCLIRSQCQWNMARSTYMKKIAPAGKRISSLRSPHQPTIDHIFFDRRCPAGAASFGTNFGFQYVFLLGSAHCGSEFSFAALRIKNPG